MSGYANTKRRKIRKFLIWLSKNKGVTIDEGSNHTTITCIHNGKKTPSPVRHSNVDKHLVMAMVKWLIENDVCTKEECDQYLL